MEGKGGWSFLMSERLKNFVAESEERFRSIFMSSPNGMALVGIDGLYLRVNRALIDITGYTEEELLSLKSQEITHPDDLEMDGIYKRKLNTGEITHYRLEKRYRHKKGHYVWVYISGSLVRDAQGNPLYRVAEIEDITLRKKNEAELVQYRNQLEELVKERTMRLADSESRIRTIMNSMLDGLVTINAEGVIEEWNPAAERIFGYAAGEIVGMQVSVLMPESYAIQHQQGIKHYLQTGEARVIGSVRELTGKRKDGSLIPLEIAVSEVFVTGRRLFSGIVRDISKRKKAEERLRDLALVVQETDNIVIINDKHGAITWVNAAFSRVTGYVLEEVAGRRPGDLLQGEGSDPETIKNIEDALKECRPIQAEILNYAKNGRKYWVEINMQPVFDKNHALTHFIEVSNEITERKHIEQLRAVNERNIKISKVVAEAANASRSPEEALQVVVDSISRYSGWPVGHVYELDKDLDQLVDGAIWHVEDPKRYEAFIRSSETIRFSSGVGLPGMVMQSKKAMWMEDLNDIQQFLRSREAYQAGIKSAVAFPVIVKDKVVAVLEFFSNESQALDAGLLELMQQVGVQIGIVVERTEAQRNLMQLFRAVENSPATVIITDNSGAIEYANPRFAQISGYTVEEALGMNPRILKSGVHSEAFYTELWATLLGGREWHGEFCNCKKNGELYWESASISPIRDESGSITHFVAVKEDITVLKQTMQELEQAKDAADAANRSKGEFLANMSHEVRTPLNAILGFSNLLQKQELSPALRDYIQKIHSAGLLLLGVVNDILDFSKIEAGKMEFEKTRFKLDEVFTSVISVVQQKAIDNEIELLLNVSPILDLSYLGDPLRLSQVLTNLMSNAIKFTQRGEVELSVVPLQKKDDRIQLKFSVRDTGIGMEQHQIANLFQAFKQADGSITRRYGGTGLGLSISRRLVELMDGEIWAESEPGRGSIFYFTIWLEQLGAEKEPSLPQPLSQLKILVADDNRTSRKVLTAILSRISPSVDVVDSGYAALAAVRDAAEVRPYQLVFMDWRMPDLDGIEATRRMKADPSLAHKPSVIVVSSFGRDAEEKKACAAGADGYLRKPITASTLMDEVVRVMDPDLLRRANPNAVPVEPVYDFSGHRILIADDHEVNRQIITELLRETGLEIDMANNGREALQKILSPSKSCDLVLMDIQMPEMDGDQATRKIRSYERFKDLPIIAMTARALLEERGKILASGMNDVVTKPIDPRELYETLRKYLPKAQVIERTGETDQTTATLPDFAGIDLAAGLRRVGGSRQLYVQMLQKFRDHHKRDANEILKALGEQDRVAAKRIVHTVYGVAGNLGAVGVQNAAAGLERSLESGAGPDQIQKEIRRFADEWRLFGEYLSSNLAVIDAQEAEPLGNEANLARITQTLSTLFAYVEKNDGLAEDYFVENQADLAGLTKEELLRLDLYLSNYDYDAAREMLLDLAKQWGISLEKQEESDGSR